MTEQEANTLKQRDPTLRFVCVRSIGGPPTFVIDPHCLKELETTLPTSAMLLLIYKELTALRSFIERTSKATASAMNCALPELDTHESHPALQPNAEQQRSAASGLGSLS